MNVLHVVGDSKFGGGSVIISQIAQEQLALGYNVSVLTTDAEFITHLSDLGIPTINIDCIWRSYNLIHDMFGIYRLYTFLKKHKFDVIHTHTTKGGFIGRVAAYLASVDHIFHTVHGFPFSEKSSSVKINLFIFLEKILLKFTDKIIFVSNYHHLWAASLGLKLTKKNAVSIRNGVSYPVVSKKIVNDMLDIYGGRKNIVFVGRIVREKGVFDLLQAFKKAFGDNINVHLFFVGDGPDIDELKSQSSQLLNVTFTGFVSNPIDYLAIANVFVLPSYREGLSISALEAQSMGVPSILSNVGGNVEVSDNGKTALLFDVGNIDSLIACLTILVEEQGLCERLNLLAKDNYNNNFTRDSMLLGYNNIYSSLS